MTPRAATRSDIPAITDTLVRSFAREPFHRWMVQDDEMWARKAPRYFRAYIKMVLRDGAADTVDGGHGAALWLSPDNPGGSFLSRVQIPFILWRLAGAKFKDVWAILPLIERHRPPDPHWYLDVLGVDPDHEGQGVGSALLQHGLARSDASNRSVFLDTLSQDSVRFYERHGFRVTAFFSLLGDLPIWTMVRPAKASR